MGIKCRPTQAYMFSDFVWYLKSFSKLVHPAFVINACKMRKWRGHFLVQIFPQNWGIFIFVFLKIPVVFLFLHNCIHTYLYTWTLACSYDCTLVWWHAHLVASLHICILGNLHTFNIQCFYFCIFTYFHTCILVYLPTWIFAYL